MSKPIVLLLLLAVSMPLMAAQPAAGVSNAVPAAASSPQRPKTNATVIPSSAVRGAVVPKTNSATNVVITPKAVVPPPAPGVTPTPTPTPNPTLAVPSVPTPAAPAAAPQPPPAAPAASSAAKPKTEEMVPLINFDNMPLGQVLDFYSELVGRTILRASSLPITTFITLKSRGPMTKSEAIMALETVMAMNGITIVPVGEKFVKVVVEGAAAQAGGAFSSADSKDLPEAGRFVTQIVQVKYITVDDAVGAIQAFGKTGGGIIPIKGSQTLVLRDYSENVKRMLEVLEKVDTVSELNIKPEVIPIKYALAGDIAQVIGSLTSSGSGISVGRASRSGLSNTGTGSTTGGTTGSAYPGQQNLSNPSTGGMSSPSAANRSSFQSRLEGIVRRAQSAGEFQILGETKIIADERTNSLLIFANDQDMVMVKTIIAQLDVVLAQVLIEAILMEVSLNDKVAYGVSYLQNPARIGAAKGAGGVNNFSGSGQFLDPSKFLTAATTGSNASPSAPVQIQNLPGGFSYFTKVNNAFDVAVTAAASDGRFHILSRPRVQTSHAVEARLFIGETVPYVTGTYFGGYNGQPSSQYQQKEVGISLNVLPLINPDGLVVMDISQNIEKLGDDVEITGVGKVPKTKKREALAKVAVKDGETIILGGFIETTKSKSKSGVPYLKDIPVFGALFRSRTESTDRSELMVFIRPTVLPTPEIAASVAASDRDKLPGVKAAEWEIREEERKRNEEIEREMRKKLGLKEPKTKTTSQ